MEKLQREITVEKEQLLQLRYSCDRIEDMESKQKFTLLIVSSLFTKQKQFEIVVKYWFIYCRKIGCLFILCSTSVC